MKFEDIYKTHDPVQGLPRREINLDAHSHETAFQHLAGEMLATLEVNYRRGLITTADDKDFERMLQRWRGWFSSIKNTGVTHPSGHPPTG